MKKLWFIILNVCLFLSITSGCGFTYENRIYIWQRAWTPDIQTAIKEIQSISNNFIVLCGDLQYKNPQINLTPADINWDYFNKDALITLAFRIHTQARVLLEKDDTADTIKGIKKIVNNEVAAAGRNKIQIKGIQFDYDCPTSRLAHYADFLQKCKSAFPNLEISFTALPVWLNNKDFLRLAELSSYYVLQLHSFEKPKNMQESREIFPLTRAVSYADKAATLNHPYFLSLPTYGYEVAFTRTGRFMGLRAENNPVLWGTNVEIATVMTAPEHILSFLNHMKKSSPKNLMGFCWYRLPLKSDEFNWDMKTLKAVLDGRLPKTKLRLELTGPKDGLYELYLVNEGERNINNPVSFRVNWPKKTPVVYDVLEQFKIITGNSANNLRIEGPAPRVGNRMTVSWFRSANHQEQNVKFNVSEVTNAVR